MICKFLFAVGNLKLEKPKVAEREFLRQKRKEIRVTRHQGSLGPEIWSVALHEETHVDWRCGRITNANLAEYRVPVNADIGEIDVSAIAIPDYKLDLFGARGVGEIGITETGAAISNAIFQADPRLADYC